MKRWKKVLSHVLVVMLALTGGSALSGKVSSAGSKNLKAECSGEMCVADGVMYYSLGEKGLYAYHLKTKKITRIKSTKVKKYATAGFYDLTVKGDYIYATWNQSGDYEVHVDYVYRFSKDGKKAERLAKGNDPVLAGNRIYYNRLRATDGDGEEYLGYGSMKLDGSGKKKIKKPKFSWSASSASGTLEGRIYNKRTSGNYRYYLKNRKIMCQNQKSKKVTEVVSWEEGLTLEGFCVHGQHVLFCVSEEDTNSGEDKLTYYYVKGNGKNFKKLAELESV